MDFTAAAEEIKATKYPYDNEMTVEKIEAAIRNYYEDLADEINSDPNGYFQSKYYFWRTIEKS